MVARDSLARPEKVSAGGPAFCSLVRFLAHQSFSLSILKERLGTRGKGWAGHLYLALLVAAFVPIISLVTRLALDLTVVAVALGQPHLPIFLTVVAGQFLAFVLGFPYLMSSLYFADDLPRLRVLPLAAWQIMGAKLSIVYLWDLLSVAPLLWPFLVVFGLRQQTGVAYWFGAAISYLLLPAVPLALSLLAVAFLMRVTNVPRKRDLLRVGGGLLVFGFILVFQLLVSRLSGLGRIGAQKFLSPYVQHLAALGRDFPLATWVAQALAAPNIATGSLYLGLFAGASLVAGAVTMLVAQHWFLGGLSGSQEVSVRTKRTTVGSLGKTMRRTRHPGVALFLREHRLLTRTPAFFLTSLLNLCVLPIMLLFSFVGGSIGKDAGISALLQRLGPTDLLSLGAVGLVGLVIALDQVPATAFSREGRLFWLSKVIPISPRLQVRTKLWYAMSYAGLHVAIAVIMAALLLHLPRLNLILVAALGIAVAWPLSSLGLICDLLNPKLDWTEPQQAMKGNLNGLLGGLLGGLLLVMLAGVVYVLHRAGHLLPWGYLAVGGLACVVGLVLEITAERLAEMHYTKIEI